MKISELAAQSGTSVASIKFYLREGLLQPGVRTSATRAEYDTEHVARLRLIRALVDVAGLSIAQVRGVIEALTTADADARTVLGTAYLTLADRPPTSSSGRVRAVLADLGWSTHPQDPVLARLEETVTALDAAGVPPTDEMLSTYARAALQIADADLNQVDVDHLDEGLTTMVVGTILYEPLLVGLRRLAHAHVLMSRMAPKE